MARRASVLRLATAGPGDTAALAAAIDAGEVDPASIVAIVGKTEGNGCVNDFTRGYATLALKLLLAERLKCAPSEIEKRVAVVMSGGTEGGLSPHLLVFCRSETDAAAPAPRLAIGVGLTRAFVPEEIGRQAQIEETAAAVATAMKDAGIATPADVHFVQIKCPLLTKERIEEAERRGVAVATQDTYHSMALSRGASALGVALALGEIARAEEASVCRDWSLYSSVASTSAGVELLRNEIVVLGNSAGWGGDLVIGHDVMAAADELVDARRLGVLLSLLDRVERSDVAAPAVRAHLLSAEMLRHILLNEPVELDAAHRLLELCDVAHAESMLDALSLSESPTTRQLVLQRLRELGDVIREQVVARLGDADWYVLRNLLALLGAMRTLPARLSIDAYFRHDEPTVRVEALRLLVRMPDRRETAVHDALLDHDPRVLRAALDAAASHGLPRRSGARLLQVVEKADRDNDLRVRGIALLPQAPTNLARDWLFKLVLRRRGFFRRWALQDPSSEQLAALRALAAGWRADPAVARALALAVASRDPQVREAVNALAAR